MSAEHPSLHRAVVRANSRVWSRLRVGTIDRRHHGAPRENTFELFVDVVHLVEVQRKFLPRVGVAAREINPFGGCIATGRDVLVHEAGKLDEGVVPDPDRASIERVRGLLHRPDSRFGIQLRLYVYAHVHAFLFQLVPDAHGFLA